MVEVGVGPGIVVQHSVGALEAAEEVLEAWMRATRNPASAFRLALHQCDLHGAQPG
ncbi:hypothetical protein ABIG06_007523 [Bradyrhizobium sp. USDA 326]|uniref:hypothetical protein n=1 Tax=unclassified Bradyrhizobium TaxID=2631580 RepID=UPI00351689E2